MTEVIQANNDVIDSYKNRAGKFIIATNRLDSESFSCDEMLIKYKEKQNGERGVSKYRFSISYQPFNLRQIKS